MYPRYYYAIILFLALLLQPNIFRSEVFASPSPRFDDIIVTTSDTHLLLFGELRDSLTEEMIEGLHSGIPINFSFFVELERNEENWPDELLARFTFSHRLSFDTLKDSYIVETEEQKTRKSVVSTIDEAAHIVNEINGLRIIELGELKPDQTYRIRVKADLYKKTLPLSLHAIIPFVSWWDVRTEWYTVEFTY